MAENTVRPPEIPKPSSSISSATNKLKNRLIFGTSKLPINNNGTEIDSPSILLGPATLKGFGEDQFDIADGLDQSRSIAGIAASSMWSENTFTRNLHNSSILTGRIQQHAGIQHQKSIVGKSQTTNKLHSQTNPLPVPGRSQSTIANKSNITKKSITPYSTNKLNSYYDAKRSRKEKLNSNIMPHLSLSQQYHDNDWSDVASSIAFNETEFCYIQPNQSDQYKFSLQDNYSSKNILKNDFTTISKYGILRSSVITGQSEMISHEDMLVEQNIYHQLIQLRVFKQFRLWKTFYIWRKSIKLSKYELAVRLIVLCIYTILYYTVYT